MGAIARSAAAGAIGVVLLGAAAGCGTPTHRPHSAPTTTGSTFTAPRAARSLSAADPARTSSTPRARSPSAAAGSASTSPQRTEPLPPRPDPGSFSLVVHTVRGTIVAAVAPISVSSHAPVDPPHDTPQEWNTAVWVVQAAYPASPSTGTTYVYGHACHHHVCPFTNLKDATVGDTVVVTTPAGVLTYRISQIGVSPRSASSLPSWASDSTAHNRVVLVTCQYEQGDVSINNIVAVAVLKSAVPLLG